MHFRSFHHIWVECQVRDGGAGHADHSPGSLPGTLWKAGKELGQWKPGSVAHTTPCSSSNAFLGSQLPQNKGPKLTATFIEQLPCSRHCAGCVQCII